MRNYDFWVFYQGYTKDQLSGAGNSFVQTSVNVLRDIYTAKDWSEEYVKTIKEKYPLYDNVLITNIIPLKQ